MKDSLAYKVNEARKKIHIHNILQTLKVFENHKFEGEIIQYFVKIYESMIVLEDFYPDLYSRCKKEVGIDYKQIASYLREYNPNLSPLKKKIMGGTINLSIGNAIKKIPAFKEFILRYFNSYFK